MAMLLLLLPAALSVTVGSQQVNSTAKEVLQTLFETSSPYNRNIFVKHDLVNNVRYLTFKDSASALKQSVVKLRHFGVDSDVDPDFLDYEGQYVYKGMLSTLAMLDRPPNSVLVAGLGGGTLPNFLNAHYPNMRIDIVEVDPKVINIAKDFMGFRQDKQGKIQVYVEDIRSFFELGAQSTTYDVVFLDCFGIAGKIPFQTTTEEFLRSAMPWLTPEGIIVMHVRIKGPQSDVKRESIVKTFQSAKSGNGTNLFKHVYKIKVPESHVMPIKFSPEQFVLIADPYAMPIDKSDLIKRAHQISVVRNYPFDMAEVVALSDPSGQPAFDRLQPLTNSSIMVRSDKDMPEQADPVYLR